MSDRERRRRKLPDGERAGASGEALLFPSPSLTLLPIPMHHQSSGRSCESCSALASTKKRRRESGAESQEKGIIAVCIIFLSLSLRFAHSPALTVSGESSSMQMQAGGMEAESEGECERRGRRHLIRRSHTERERDRLAQTQRETQSVTLLPHLHPPSRAHCRLIGVPPSFLALFSSDFL